MNETPPSARQRELLAQDRWAWLRDLLHYWYAEPLTARDGSPLELIDAAQERLGVRLPTALREWYELVGQRLDWIQDRPLPLELLEVTDGRILFWVENQGVWQVLVRPDGEDPEATATQGDAGTAVPLSSWLRALTVSDTLVAVWSGAGHGILGRLSPETRGEVFYEFTAHDVERLTAAYPELPIPPLPYWSAPPRGGSPVIIRCDGIDGAMLEWATATDDAFASLGQVLDLERGGDW